MDENFYKVVRMIGTNKIDFQYNCYPLYWHINPTVDAVCRKASGLLLNDRKRKFRITCLTGSVSMSFIILAVQACIYKITLVGAHRER